MIKLSSDQLVISDQWSEPVSLWVSGGWWVRHIALMLLLLLCSLHRKPFCARSVAVCRRQQVWWAETAWPMTDQSAWKTLRHTETRARAARPPLLQHKHPHVLLLLLLFVCLCLCNCCFWLLPFSLRCALSDFPLIKKTMWLSAWEHKPLRAQTETGRKREMLVCDLEATFIHFGQNLIWWLKSRWIEHYNII